MTETIYFNGKKYNNISEMPSSVRQLYENLIRLSIDDNKDGIPDMIQTGGLSGIKEMFSMIKDIGQLSTSEGFDAGQPSLIRVSDTGIYINGKIYPNVADMPEYTRKEYETIVNAAEDGVEDIFDESWRKTERSKFFNPHDDEVLNQYTSNIETPIEMVDSTGRFIIIAAVAFLIFAAGAAAWLLFI